MEWFSFLNLRRASGVLAPLRLKLHNSAQNYVVYCSK